MNWMSRIRLRVLALVVGIALLALGAISLTAIPAWPVVGVAVAFVAMAVNRAAARLDQPICLTCGHDIGGEPAGEHGMVCSKCGSVNDSGSAVAGAEAERTDGGRAA